MAGVRDDQLGDPTPCDRCTVAELLEHVGEFAAVFTTNARKEEPVAVEGLPADWWTSLPPFQRHGRRVAGLVRVAGSGQRGGASRCPPRTTPWWSSRRRCCTGGTSRGQEFTPDEEWLVGVDGFLTALAEPIASGQGPYGPAVAVPQDASHLHRILGAAGRDPGWTASP